MESVFQRAVVACVLWGLIPAPDASAIDPETLQKLEVLRDGYLANRTSFTHGTCRFTYRSYARLPSPPDAEHATVENLTRLAVEAALGDGFADGPSTAFSGPIVMHMAGDQLVVKAEIDSDWIQRAMKENLPIITPTTVARKGGYALDHDGLANNVVMHSPENDRLHIRYQPFNLAVDADVENISSTLTYAESLNFQGVALSVEEDVERDGHRYVKVTSHMPDERSVRTHWIDPKRGFLPYYRDSVYHDSVDRLGGRLRSRGILLSVHEEDGRFFPMHAIDVDFVYPEDGAPYVYIWEMKVENLDLSYEPTAEDLTVYLPKYAQYSDGINPNTAKTLFASVEGEFAPVSVDDVEPIYHQLQALAAEREKEDAERAAVHAVVSESSFRRGRLYVFLGLLNVIILGVFLLAWRRHQSRIR